MRARKGNMITRKNIRIQGYDYKKAGYYFITICTKDMKELFGSIIDNKMQLNEKGNIIKNIIESYNENSKNVKNEYYQIMPNHIHIIIHFIEDNNVSISTVVSNLKAKCTKELKMKNMWQRNYYERIIRNEKEYKNVIEYINNNPYMPKYNW